MPSEAAVYASLVTLYLWTLGTLLAKIFLRLTPRGGLVDYWLGRPRPSQELLDGLRDRGRLLDALRDRGRRARRGEE